MSDAVRYAVAERVAHPVMLTVRQQADRAPESLEHLVAAGPRYDAVENPVLGDECGLVLFHENYFQHNILEAGAHWADCPWRPANNVNDTGLPEPPPATTSLAQPPYVR